MFQFLHVDEHTNKTKSNQREESTLKSCSKAIGANENRFQFLAKSEKLLCSYFRPQKPNLVHRTVIPCLVGCPQLKSRMGIRFSFSLVRKQREGLGSWVSHRSRFVDYTKNL